MPHNKDLAPFNNPYEKHFNEKPRTIFKDLEDSMKVELQGVYGIDNALIESVICGYETKALDTITKKNTDVNQIVVDLLNGGNLWQGLECIHFKFKVIGITRILTHQLVRQRIGISFSQQCSGEVDWRHADCLMPRCLGSNYLYYQNIVNAKQLYANAMDHQKISVQDARYILPHCLETFIYFDCSLATLVSIYTKRTCIMSNAYEMHLFAEKLKAAVLEQVPALSVALANPCEKKKCWYHSAKASGNNVFLWQPDEMHDNFEYNKDSYLYDKTHKQMSSSPIPVRTEYYVGTVKVSEALYLSSIGAKND